MNSVKVKKADRNIENHDGTRNPDCNDGICTVRLNDRYIGAVSQTNYYCQIPSHKTRPCSCRPTPKWVVWEWMTNQEDRKYEQIYNLDWRDRSTFDGNSNNFSQKKFAVKALIDRELRLDWEAKNLIEEEDNSYEETEEEWLKTEGNYTTDEMNGQEITR